MPNSTANVAAGKPAIGGAIFRAAAGTTLPTDASTALSSDFKLLGYVNDAGLVNTNNPEITQIKAWGGDTVMVVNTSKDDTFKFTLIECLNIEALKAVYGDDNVTEANDKITITANNSEQEAAVYAIDIILGEKLKRIVIPSGKVSGVGDITYADSSAVGYETTVSCLPDGNGNTHYEYIEAA